MLDYADCYATLGATPGTDWETLRANYKRLIGQWHPDRFSEDPPSKRVAEERSKRITTAYQILEKYRRDHGVLPPVEPVTASEEPPPQQPAPAPRPRFDIRGTGRPRAPTGESTKHERGLWRGVAVACFALACALFLLSEVFDLWDSDDKPPETPPPIAEVAAPAGTGTISTGSTLGEVYSVQGVPTSTEGQIWHYGKSRIRFAQGKVVSWEEHPDNPLRIADSRSVPAHERVFNVGSSKNEVRAIQGSPITEGNSTWHYGPSRVFFDGDRVTSWRESPLHPLRVPR